MLCTDCIFHHFTTWMFLEAAFPAVATALGVYFAFRIIKKLF